MSLNTPPQAPREAATVPSLGRVFATATGINKVVALDETTTNAVLASADTGKYPDGMTYDSRRNRLWVTNETGGTETVLDATTLHPVGTVGLGGQAGNVAYHPLSDRVFVAAQDADGLAVIDPESLQIVKRVPLPGCAHPHGVAMAPDSAAVFVACDANATLVSVDPDTGTILSRTPVGGDPDVLAIDPSAHRLYVAAESGAVTICSTADHAVTVLGQERLGDNAHVVAVDSATHRSYYPLRTGTDGYPALLVAEPT